MISIHILLQQAPFVMKKDSNKTTGNDNFYGYCIDLLKEILNNTEPFDYTIRVVGDGQFGSKSQQGEWTGMIGELAKKVYFIVILCYLKL